MRSLRSLSVISYKRILLSENLLTLRKPIEETCGTMQGKPKGFFRWKKSEPIPDNHYSTFEKYYKGFAPIFEVWYNCESDKTFFSYKYHTKTVACILTAKQTQADMRNASHISNARPFSARKIKRWHDNSEWCVPLSKIYLN